MGEEPRAILAWISNSDRSSYYQMAVAGHTFFRLNYPIRLNRWYHSCYSWNGKTGEWQLWINAERVGRGFYNRVSIPHPHPVTGAFQYIKRVIWEFKNSFTRYIHFHFFFYNSNFINIQVKLSDALDIYRNIGI